MKPLKYAQSTVHLSQLHYCASDAHIKYYKSAPSEK